MARHCLVLPNAARGLAHTDRTNTAVEHGTVAGRTATNTETLHNALKAFALSDASDVDKLAFSESGDGDHITDFISRRRVEANFAQNPRGIFKTRFGSVSLFGLGGVLGFLLGEADLDGVVAVGLQRLDLDDWTWAGFDHGDGDQDVLSVVDLRHPDFFTEECAD